MTEPFSLPKTWAWANFGDVAWIASDLVDPVGFQQAPHIAPNHVESKTGRLLPYSTVKADGVTSPKHRFREGQILYSKIRPYLAKVVQVDFSGLCSADMYPIETAISSRFLFWWMLTPAFTQAAAGHQARSVLPKINARALATVPVPVPPLAEQRRIIVTLEDHLARLDAAEASLRRATKRLEAHRRARLWELTHLSTDVRQVRLRDIAEVRLGRQRSPNNHSGDTMRPYLRAANVGWSGLLLGDVKEMNFSDKEAQTYKLRPGDILLSEASGSPGEVGKPAIWNGELDGCCFQNTLIRVRLRSDNPEFLTYYLRAEALNGQFVKHSRGVGIRHLGAGQLAEWPIGLPSAEAQQEIVDKVADVEIALGRFEVSLKSAERRYLKLRSTLLSEAFAGRLASRDPNDEPATELLTRINADRAAGRTPRQRRTAKKAVSALVAPPVGAIVEGTQGELPI